MMTRMFGFCGCWARAGSPEIVPIAVKAVRASSPDRMLRTKLMVYSPGIVIASEAISNEGVPSGRAVTRGVEDARYVLPKVAGPRAGHGVGCRQRATVTRSDDRTSSFRQGYRRGCRSPALASREILVREELFFTEQLGRSAGCSSRRDRRCLASRANRHTPSNDFASEPTVCSKGSAA